jgi:hypothetical protein
MMGCSNDSPCSSWVEKAIAGTISITISVNVLICRYPIFLQRPRVKMVMDARARVCVRRRRGGGGGEGTTIVDEVSSRHPASPIPDAIIRVEVAEVSNTQ